MKIKILIALALSITITFFSCKEPDSIGLDLVETELQDNTLDTITLNAYSVIDDSVKSSSFYISYLLGDYMDPVFGEVEGSFYTQFKPSKLQQEFGENPKIDSIILILDPVSQYGNTSQPMNFKIHRIIEDFYNDSTYYLSSSLEYDLSTIADTNFAPVIGDTIIIEDSTKVKFHYRIKLAKSFAEYLIDLAENTNAYNDFESFVKEMKGLYVKTDKRQQNGESILSIDLLDSKMTLYYNDSLSYDYTIVDTCAKITHVDHNYDYAHHLLKSQLDGDTTIGNDYIFVQPLGGIATKIQIPHLKEWSERTDIGINSARLIIEVDEDFITDTITFPLPQSLALIEKTDSAELFLQDEVDKIIDGTYNPEINGYIFNITRHIQDRIINGRNEYSLYLMARSKAVAANRVVLKGPSRANGMTLKLVYTKF